MRRSFLPNIPPTLGLPGSRPGCQQAHQVTKAAPVEARKLAISFLFALDGKRIQRFSTLTGPSLSTSPCFSATIFEA